MRHVFLTGAPGIGKSTLIMRLTEKLREENNVRICGFRTDEVRQQPGGRVGFDVITVKGQQQPLSRIGEQVRGPRVGRYVVDVPSFESAALSELQLALKGGADVCVLDEIGKMELFSRSFFPTVQQVLSQPHVLVLGTIPAMKPDGKALREVEEVRGRKDVTVVTVTQQNRNTLVSELFDLLLQRIKGISV